VTFAALDMSLAVNLGKAAVFYMQFYYVSVAVAYGLPFYPRTTFTDHWTGPDSSCSYVYFLVLFR